VGIGMRGSESLNTFSCLRATPDLSQATLQHSIRVIQKASRSVRGRGIEYIDLAATVRSGRTPLLTHLFVELVDDVKAIPPARRQAPQGRGYPDADRSCPAQKVVPGDLHVSSFGRIESSCLGSGEEHRGELAGGQGRRWRHDVGREEDEEGEGNE
jgi:hypothetical protein